ncbi:UDP-glucose--hexose-1-phosphate uridylyltransferase [Leuconostoc citreum]|uniref:UDP-glucose--hexose-1-phosphate uridylyltransferase n=1 Tax=Leuconostoc citreum TaxID=33964 RepID=UPI002A7FFEC6|nr:UDP-glucose--hexose-1-phosphate uridylyltransferase [Leuconostoc citreum]MDY5162124.1 UDP-glucose--hexose-1-phosphate uridylyltransferase [Leuconostoc citreum]MDY5165719.1 UDP-glucose--hexose-1-phosphate uridylyltransferase [Leuconostoc citreum]
MTTAAVVSGFVQQIIMHSEYEPLDTQYLVNRVLALIGETSFQDTKPRKGTTLQLLDALLDIAVANQAIRDITAQRDQLASQLMNFFASTPSRVNQRFWHLYKESPSVATDDFYNFSKRTNYIKTREIAQNIFYQANTDFGQIDITINLSKPEKNPRDIAAALQAPITTYPVNQLSFQNEGFIGTATYPARTNHRIIRVPLVGENWGFQYSPYAYFNEHAIILAPVHRPMKIDRLNLSRLLAFVDQFPDYFVGSNADLPIVGGSILSHDHFQGGRYDMPMAKAKMASHFPLGGLKDAGILKWPMSVIRLVDSNQVKLLDAAEQIMAHWQFYADVGRHIEPYSTDGTRHHTVTPIVRKKGNDYELDLVLRDNNTSAEFPEGIFHPHPDVQHIKQENIGLIEVMGLAILPPRLKNELQAVQNYLVDSQTPIASKHAVWAQQLHEKHGNVSLQEAKIIVRQSVADIFIRVLSDAGVFKCTPDGQAGFKQFIDTLR